ncbi:hypothetical protein [Paraburkholderia sp. 31.1]|nr:hypothetical protein [Paraburkholderia sp. 31.1]
MIRILQIHIDVRRGKPRNAIQIKPDRFFLDVTGSEFINSLEFGYPLV